jgi:hypothetical protein
MSVLEDRVITAYYQNQTDKWLILRVPNPQLWLERALCPGQTVCFQVNRSSRIEIYTYSLVTMMIEEIILAEQLSQVAA